MSVIIDGFDVSDTDDWWGWTYTGGKAARGFVEPAARADFFNEIALARMAQHGPGAVKVYPASRGRSYFYTYERPFVADTVTGRAWEGIRAAWVYSGDDPAMARVFGCCTGPAVIDPFSEPTVESSGWQGTSAAAIVVPADLTNSMLVVFIHSTPSTNGSGSAFTGDYGGAPLTEAPDTLLVNTGRMQAFYLFDPPADPTGAGAHLTLLAGGGGQMGGWAVLSGVNQSDPFADTVTATGTGTTSGCGAMSGSGVAYLNAVLGLSGSTHADPTANGGQSPLWLMNASGWALESGGGAGVANPTWIHSDTKDWVAIGLAINGA